MGMGRNISGRKTLILLFFLAAGMALSEPLSLSVPVKGPSRTLFREALSQALPPLQGHQGPLLFSIDIPDNEIVAGYISYYLAEGRRVVELNLKRSGLYRRFIAARIDFLALPGELFFVPAVESTFYNRAVSRSGAVGLWQFMQNTSVHFNLLNDNWLDERRDFWKASIAALKKLEENYEYFADWYLALAAYNCGKGKLRRLISESGVSDFWILRKKGLLPVETADYVPKFLALAHICSYPGRYGFKRNWEPSPRWERTLLKRSIDLRLLAGAAGVGLEYLKEANSELKYSVTPDYPAGYWLKYSEKYKDVILKALNDPKIELMEFHLHTIHSGDTLYGLSLYYRATVAMIKSCNLGLDPLRLPLGGALLIPAMPGVSLKHYSEKRAEGESLTGAYEIKKGDTLWSIARFFRITPEELAMKNGLKLKSIILPGQIIKVPGKKERKE
jgi:membrane-bound lytic murein transglycosylase D